MVERDDEADHEDLRAEGAAHRDRVVGASIEMAASWSDALEELRLQ